MNRAAASGSWMAWCWPLPACRACYAGHRHRTAGPAAAHRPARRPEPDGAAADGIARRAGPGARWPSSAAATMRATRALLAVLEDAPTRNAVTIERTLLGEHGGGCHQRFGATLYVAAGHWAACCASPAAIPWTGTSPSGASCPIRRCLRMTGAVRAWDGSAVEKAAATPLLDAAALATAAAPRGRVRRALACPAGGCRAARWPERRCGPRARRAGSRWPRRACGCRAAAKAWARKSRRSWSPNPCCDCRHRATGMCSRMRPRWIPGRRAAGPAPM